MSVAIVTGASRGLGEALAAGLAGAGWSIVVDARGTGPLRTAEEHIRRRLMPGQIVRAVPGDVNDAAHRSDLLAAARELGGLDLLVNNAGTLGPSPLPSLTTVPIGSFRETIEANLLAPLALIQEAASLLDRATRPRVLNLTSDAAVEAYPGWGCYGASKAALDLVSAVLAAEQPGWAVWAVDPGDMRTQMHQDAFPGEDISDRPEPGSVVPALLALIDSDRPSGRLRASELVTGEPVDEDGVRA